MQTTPVILDVDTGADDALAILFAARHPALDLRAVTCVSGNTHVDQVVHNTHAVLEAAGVRDLPVARGAERPLVNAPLDATYFHGPDGLAGLSTAVEPVVGGRSDAVDLLREQIVASPTPVTVVPLGPMTNIALLLRTHPDVLANVERVVFMGGSAGTGNASAVAEYNVWIDPEALAVVLSCDVPVTMYGLDVFYAPVIGPQTYTVWQVHTDPAVRMAGHLTAHLHAVVGDEPRSGNGGGLGDAGAVCSIVDPSLLRVRRLPVQVEIAPGVTRGQVVVDRRELPGEDVLHGLHRSARPVDVALGVDAPRLVDLFANTLLAGPPPAP
ncbi:MAG: nucleoside hydrolase [Mycobacteriales bacterium]